MGGLGVVFTKFFLKFLKTIVVNAIKEIYKLISATLSNRLKPTLDKIVGISQKAYIPGRYIAECTRNTWNVAPN